MNAGGASEIAPQGRSDVLSAEVVGRDYALKLADQPRQHLSRQLGVPVDGCSDTVCRSRAEVCMSIRLHTVRSVDGTTIAHEEFGAGPPLC